MGVVKTTKLVEPAGRQDWQGQGGVHWDWQMETIVLAEPGGTHRKCRYTTGRETTLAMEVNHPSKGLVVCVCRIVELWPGIETSLM